MESPYITSGTGSLSVGFANGVITSSNDSGIFDGLLPAVGLPSNFGFNLGGSDGFIDIGYDFGPLNNNGYDITVSAEAEGQVEEIPEPSTLLLLGIGLPSLIGHVRRCRRHVA